MSRLPAYSDRARPAYGELFRRIRRAFPVVGVRSAYGEVFRCMGSVMPSLRARPARVGVLKTTRSGSGRCRIVPLMWGYVRLPEPAHCGHWALLACVRKLGLSSTDPPLHGGSPRPCGEVSYSGTSSEFSRGSTSLVWESSGKMSPTPSASGGSPRPCGEVGQDEARPVFGSGCSPPMWGVCYIEPNKLVLSAHVGKFLNGFPSTPDALAVPFVWGCFAVGAVEPPSRGLSRPRRGRMGETGIVSPPGGIRRVRHRRCRGVRETPFSERSACRIYCRRRRGGMRWARHLPY